MGRVGVHFGWVRVFRCFLYECVEVGGSEWRYILSS